MGLGYGAVEDVFVELHEVAERKRVAFRARLKHLKRLGFPPGTNTGTGRAVSYGGPEIFLIGLALEMLQLGLTPERAVHVIRENMQPIAAAARLAIFALNKPEDDGSSMYLYFDPSAFSNLTDATHDEAEATLWYAGRGTLMDFLADIKTMWPRLAILNVSALISHVFSLLHSKSPEAAANFETELTSWLDSHPEDATDGDT